MGIQTTAFQWEIDPSSGDYVQVNGSPVMTAELTHPAYYRCKVPRKKWLYAPDDNYGSDFASFRGKQNTANTSVLESMAQRAMAPIVQDGRATEIDVTTIARSRNGTQLETKITTPQGEVETLQFDPIGNI